MSVKSLPSLTNANISPWWVCPPDRELALRAKIRTGFSTIGGRVRNENKTFMKIDPPKQEPQAHSARSFHSSLRMSPSLYRRLTSIQTHKKNNSCKHCDCGGMVSESNLSDHEIETIKKVVARAEAMDRADAVRIGCLILQFKELQGKCSGNGTSNCLLCDDDLTPGKNVLIDTCDYCEKAVCTRCRVPVDAKLASGQPVICCKVCSEEQELWRRSGAWLTMSSPKVAIPDDELLEYKAEIDRSKTPVFTRGYSMVDAPVGESVRTPSICSDLSDGDLDISNALLKFNLPRQGSSNANDEDESRPGTRSPLEMFSLSPTLGRTTPTMFDEVEEMSQTGLDDLLRSHSMKREEGSPHFGERLNRLQKSSVKRTGAVRKSRKSKPQQSKTMPLDMKYSSNPEMLLKLAESQEELSRSNTQQETTFYRDAKFRLSSSSGRVEKSRPRHVTTPERDGELSHSSESYESSSDSELGEPLIIASTPSDGPNKIIGVVPDIVVQEPSEASALHKVEAEVSWSVGDVDKSTGQGGGDQHGTMAQEPDQEEEQEQRYHRPRSYAVRSQPGASPILERRRMCVSSDEEGRAASRERSVEKRRKRANSGGFMKDLGSSDEDSSILEKAHALERRSDASKESTPRPSHQAASFPSPTTAVEEGFSPVPVSSDAVAEQSMSVSPEPFVPAVVPREAASRFEQGVNLSLEDTPPFVSIAQNGSDKSLHDAPEDKVSVVVDKSISPDMVMPVTPVSTAAELKEELSLDSTPFHAFSEPLTVAESVGASVENGEGRSPPPPHDSISDLLFRSEVERVVEAAPRQSVEGVSQQEVASIGQAKDLSAEESSDSLPRSTSLANGKERYQFRRRGATRMTHKSKDSSPSREETSSISMQEKAKMAASRIRSDARHISSVRERHQNDAGLDLSEEMLPYGGSSDFNQKDDDDEEGHPITQRRRRDRVRNARPVQRREARLSSSRRRQYEEQDHSDL